MFNDIRELKEQVEHIYAVLNRIFALGKVVAVDEEKALVRVKLEEHDDLTTYWLPVLFTKTQLDKEYWLPDIDDMVLCVFTPPAFERGFVLGSFYTQEDAPPEANRNKWIKKFKDRTVIEYDRTEHRLFIDVKGDLQISVNNSNITSITTHNGDITVNGNLFVNGNITASQNIADLNGAKGSLAELRDTYNSHTHDGDSGGTTSTPNQTI